MTKRLAPNASLNLWSKAGGMCARCKTRLLLSFRDKIGKIKIGKIGEEAHIISRKSKGPRGHQKEDRIDDVDSEENVILLCKNCHSTIDRDQSSYSPQKLLDIKEEHEKSIREVFHQSTTQEKEEWMIKGSGKTEIRICSNINEVLIEAVTSEKFEEISPTKWRCSSTSFKYKELKTDSLVDFMSVDSFLDSEFGIEDNSFYILEYTYDPWNEPLFVPFIKRIYSFLPYKENIELLFQPTHYKEDLEGFIKILDRQNKSSEEKEKALYGIRDIGIKNPSLAERVIKLYSGKNWCDGAIAESAADIMKELSTARKLPRN